MKKTMRIIVSLSMVALMLMVVVPYDNSEARDTGSSPVGPFPSLPDGTYWDMAWAPNAEYAAIVGENAWYVYYENENRLINYSDRAVDSYFHDVEWFSSRGSMLAVGNDSSGKAVIDYLAYEPSGTVLEWYDGAMLSSTSDQVSVTGEDGVWAVGHEYVYLTQNTAPPSVSAGDTRLVDTPRADLTYSNHGSGNSSISSYSLSKMPVAEYIYCNYSAGSWAVWGTESGPQMQTATTGSSYTLDSGVNSGRVTFTISGGSANGDQIVIRINVSKTGYPARSVVQSWDSDVGTHLHILDNAKSYQTYSENYVVDNNADGHLNEGDVRITTFAEVINYHNHATSSASYYDVAFDESSSYGVGMAVGTYGIATYINESDGTTDDLNNLDSKADYFGVAMQESSSTFFVVGSFDLDAAAFVEYPDVGDPNSYYSMNITSDIPGDPCCLINIAWNQKYDYGIVVGDHYVLRLDYDPSNYSHSWSVLAKDDGAFFQAVDWTDDYETAIIGDESGNVWRYDNGGTGILKEGNGTASSIYGIAIRPHASTPYATAIGTNGAVNYYYTTRSSSTNIVANVDLPTINDYDIKNGADVSILDAMADVDSTYMFYIDAYYVSSGGVNMWDRMNIDIYAWNDLNNAQTYYPAETDNRSCTAFHLNYTGGSNGAATGTWVVVFPYAGLDNYQEVRIVNQHETYAVESDGYEHHYLFINVSFGPQLRYSSNSGMTYVGDDSVSAGFNDADTWNMEIRAVDNTLSANRVSKYTEFGLYKYTSITVSGNPSGSSPPGQHILLDNPSCVRYAANIDYWVYLKITNLTDGMGHVIPASSVSVVMPDAEPADSQIYIWQHFPGANSELTVWDIPDAPYLGGNATYGEIVGGKLLPYAEYPSHSSVSTSDYDMGRNLVNPPAYCHVTGSDDIFDFGEFVYIDNDDDYLVSEGDVRVTSYSSYPAGSTVNAGDTDVGTSITYLSNARMTGIDDGIWDYGVDEFIIDADGSWNITSGDVRVGLTSLVTGVYWALDIPVGIPQGSYTATITYTIYHP